MKTILVVDDDKMNLATAKNLLAQEYKIIAVNSGKMALTYLQRNLPDLILLDIKMPEMSGLDVMEQILENEVWKTVPVIFLTADTGDDTEVQCFEMGAADFISKPFIPAVMKSRIRRTLELEGYRKNLEGAVKIQAEEIASQDKRIVNIQHEVIWGMANLIESRDGTTGGHVKRTRTFVKMIAEQLQKQGAYAEVLSDKYVATLCEAAPMHDIGKIAVPDYILKGTTKLTDAEFDEMKNHAAAGAKIIHDTMEKIEDEFFIRIACNVANYHHEKWDGSGYPEGRRGEEIPLEARIMAVADVFDALAFSRSYKEAKSIEQTYCIIQEAGGKHFDPQVVEAFVAVRKQIEELFENGTFQIEKV